MTAARIDCPRCGRRLAGLEWDAPAGVAHVRLDAHAAVNGTHFCPDPPPEENPMPDQTPAARPPDPVRDGYALDQMSEWLCHPDPDGQWRSAADFIEYAAGLVARTGRPITPGSTLGPRYQRRQVQDATVGRFEVEAWAVVDTESVNPDGSERVVSLHVDEYGAITAARELNR